MTELKDTLCQIPYVEVVEVEQELIEAGLPKESFNWVTSSLLAFA